MKQVLYILKACDVVHCQRVFSCYARVIMLRASCLMLEIKCHEVKIKESEKASSDRESSPWHLSDLSSQCSSTESRQPDDQPFDWIVWELPSSISGHACSQTSLQHLMMLWSPSSCRHFSCLMKVTTASLKRCNKVCEQFDQSMSEYRAGSNNYCYYDPQVVHENCWSANWMKVHQLANISKTCCCFFSSVFNIVSTCVVTTTL